MGTHLPNQFKTFTKTLPVNHQVTCYFCFQDFEITLEVFSTINTEIWDCEICCNPNRVSYLINDETFIILEISDGNE